VTASRPVARGRGVLVLDRSQEAQTLYAICRRSKQEARGADAVAKWSKSVLWFGPARRELEAVMDLLLRIGALGAFQDVRCEAETGTTVHDLADAMRRALSVEAKAEVYSHRLGGVLEQDALLVSVGVLSGDILELVPTGSRVQGAKQPGERNEVRVIVEVVDGPLTGKSWVLAAGDHTIGRSFTNDMYCNDLAVGAEHATVQVRDDGGVLITSREATFLDGLPLHSANVRIPAGARLRIGATTLTFRAKAAALTAGVDRAGQVLFNRTPHFERPVVEREIARIEQPPQPPQKPNTNWFMTVGPLVMGVVLYLMTRQVVTLAFVAMMPLMSLGSTWVQRRDDLARYEGQVERWRAELSRVNELAARELEDERVRRLDVAPSAEQVRQWIETASEDLWRRETQSASFLQVRVGRGRVNAASRIEFDTRRGFDADDGELLGEAQSLLARYAQLESAPVVCDLKTSPVLGVWGDADFTAASVGGMLMQLAGLHSPQDVIVCAAVGSSGPRFDFVQWLPHSISASSPLEGAHYVTNPLAATALCEALLSVCEQRASERHREGVEAPWFVVVVTEEAQVDPATLSRLLDRVKGCGVSLVFVGSQHTTLPRQCDSVLGGVAASMAGTIRFESSQGTIDVVADILDDRSCALAALKLAPFRDAAASSAAASIPRVVPLSQVVGAAMTDPGVVIEQWAQAVPGTLRAPIGMDADGAWLLDVVEHGPHGLIAGTSGAGKSELLQSMVVSLAAHYPPQMLNFLFVDYKGGAAFGPCLELPHSVGMVTDLNEELAMRALVSLRAELKRREHELAGRARDIVELAKIDPDGCPARLMIVVDEFATLVKEVPDFVAGMVDVAQRGRSLGIHLILATQRPAGSVSDNIVANTNLRIALRVLDASDSSNVIGTSEAAAIPAPLRGRAYVRTGPRELACVQTAWANAPMGANQERERVRIAMLGTVVRQGSMVQSDGPAELTLAVATIRDAAEGMPPQRKPWVEPLGELVLLEALLAQGVDHSGDTVAFALADDPENQIQHPVSVDWEADGGVLVMGSGGSGRTTVLRTLAGSIAASVTPQQAALYAIDFNNRALEQLWALPHTREVAHADDVERVTAVIVALEEHIKRNRALLVEHQVAAFSELVEKGVEAQRAVLLLDEYGAFHSAMEKYDAGEWTTRFAHLVTRGRQAGVHVVATADRRASVPSALFSAIGRRVVLRMADTDELIALGVKQSGEVCDGRAWLTRGMVCQIAVVNADATSRGQAEGLLRIGESCADARLAPLEQLTARVELSKLRQDGAIVLGEADLTGERVALDVNVAHVMIAGPPRSGKTNLLRVIAEQAVDAGVFVFVLSQSPVLADDRWLSGWRDDVDEIVDAVIGASTNVDMRCSALLLVDDAEELAEGTAGTRLQECVQAPGVRMIAASEAHYWARAYSGWMSDVKRQRRAVMLQPDMEADGQVVSVRLRARPGVTFETGRAILSIDGALTTLQTAIFDADGAEPLVI
jgi:S-DNA-T family DNA segregation ATPase FtsK/SpoIIIE